MTLQLLEIDGLAFNGEICTVDGVPVTIGRCGAREYLYLLMLSYGRLVRHQQAIDWVKECELDPRAISRIASYLRNGVLRETRFTILSQRGFGYRLTPE